MAGCGIAGCWMISFDIDERVAKRGAMAQKDRRGAAAEKFVVNGGGGLQAINRGNEKAINAAGKEVADHTLFPLGNVERMCKQQIVTQPVRLFFDGHDDAGVNRIRGRWNHQTEELGCSVKKSL